MSDIRQQAERLLEEEDLRAERRAREESEERHEARLQGAIGTIQRLRDEEAAATARKQAADEAEELAARRYALGEELEQAVANVNRLLGEYGSVDRRQRDAIRRAGRPQLTGRPHDTVTPWFRQRFGGFDSLTGTPAPHYADPDRPLPERDGLARKGAS